MPPGFETCLAEGVALFNAGRYYDVNGNTFADWGDTRSAYAYREYQWDEAAGDYALIWEQDPTSDPLIYCTDESLEAIDRAHAQGKPPGGIGGDSVIERAIVDKNARVGRGVRILNEAGVREADGDGYYIRDGIVIVPKGGVVHDGTVI